MFKKIAITILAITTLIFGALPVYADQDVSERVLKNHLASFGAGDVDAILADYANDAVIILPNGILKGKEQIRGLFNALVAEFSKPGMVFNLTNTKVDNHLAYITWNADTHDTSYKFATDTFIIKGGKITHQTIAFDAVPKS